MLAAWQRCGNANTRHQIDELNQELTASRDCGNEDDKERIQALENELIENYQLEGRYWKEMSRVKWFKWGNQNTHFFHSKF